MKKLFVILTLILLSCKDSSLEHASQELKETVDQIKETLHNYSPVNERNREAATEEIEKLFIFEYKVTEIKKGSDANEIEKELMKLGKERWDCFHLEPTQASLQFFCKRPPKSYLRYIPRLF